MAIKIISGFPGYGKTAILTKRAIKYMKQGYHVFTNFPVSTEITIGFKKYKITSKVFDKSMIKDRSFPENSKVFIDEIQNEYSSREWKSMSKDELQYFTGHRHFGVDIILSVQHPARVDVAIRELIDEFEFIYRSIGRFKLIQVVYHYNDVGRFDIADNMYKRRLEIVNHKVLKSYNTRYLKDKFGTTEIEYKTYDYNKSKYLTIFHKIYEKIKLKKEFIEEVKQQDTIQE